MPLKDVYRVRLWIHISLPKTQWQHYGRRGNTQVYIFILSYKGLRWGSRGRGPPALLDQLGPYRSHCLSLCENILFNLSG